jgi:hypothetical protein
MFLMFLNLVNQSTDVEVFIVNQLSIQDTGLKNQIWSDKTLTNSNAARMYYLKIINK